MSETFFYATSPCAEHWSGPHDSLEEALDVAREEYAGEHDSFWVDTGQSVDWPALMRKFADADRALEDIADYIHDNENIEEPEPAFRHGKDAMQKALEELFAEHIVMQEYWQCDGSPKEFATNENTSAMVRRKVKSK